MSQVPPDYTANNQGQSYAGTTYTPAGVSGQTVVMMPQTKQTTQYKDYLGFSIFNLLCCCLPLGIWALVKSLDTRRYNDAGNAALARKCSRTAATVNKVALGIGILLNVIVISLVIWYVVTVVNVVKTSIGDDDSSVSFNFDNGR